MESGKQSKSHSHQHVREFWVQKTNTTRNGSQLTPSRRTRREEGKGQKSTTVVHEQEKPGLMKNILMLTR